MIGKASRGLHPLLSEKYCSSVSLFWRITVYIFEQLQPDCCLWAIKMWIASETWGMKIDFTVLLFQLLLSTFDQHLSSLFRLLFRITCQRKLIAYWQLFLLKVKAKSVFRPFSSNYYYVNQLWRLWWPLNARSCFIDWNKKNPMKNHKLLPQTSWGTKKLLILGSLAFSSLLHLAPIMNR